MYQRYFMSTNFIDASLLKNYLLFIKSCVYNIFYSSPCYPYKNLKANLLQKDSN